MPEKDDKDSNGARAERLAAQLRANLRRRKEQARGLTEAPRAKSDDARARGD